MRPSFDEMHATSATVREHYRATTAGWRSSRAT